MSKMLVDLIKLNLIMPPVIEEQQAATDLSLNNLFQFVFNKLDNKRLSFFNAQKSEFIILLICCILSIS